MTQPAGQAAGRFAGLLACTHAAMPHLLRAAEDSPRRVADLVNVMMARFAGTERLLVTDSSDAITYVVTRDRRVAVNDVLIRPTEQQG